MSTAHDAHVPIRDVFQTPFVAVTAGDSLRAASAAMRDADVGALPVLDGDELAGIVSERDIVGALAAGRDPDRHRVADVMTRDPRYLTLADSVTTAAETMLEAGCRHLPVLDEGVPIGIVSIRDVVRASPT